MHSINDVNYLTQHVHIFIQPQGVGTERSVLSNCPTSDFETCFKTLISSCLSTRDFISRNKMSLKKFEISGWYSAKKLLLPDRNRISRRSLIETVSKIKSMDEVKVGDDETSGDGSIRFFDNENHENWNQRKEKVTPSPKSYYRDKWILIISELRSLSGTVSSGEGRGMGEGYEGGVWGWWFLN